MCALLNAYEVSKQLALWNTRYGISLAALSKVLSSFLGIVEPFRGGSS